MDCYGLPETLEVDREEMVNDLGAVSFGICDCRALANIVLKIFTCPDDIKEREIATLCEILCKYSEDTYQNFQTFKKKYRLI